jgi:3',5'-cyclic AMP phosphodiesterase CpdA
MGGKQQSVRGDAGVVRFAWLSDPHLSALPDLEPYRRRFAEAVAGARAGSPDFTLITGDLVDQANVESYELFHRVAAELSGPVYCVPGNHDVGEKRFAGAPPGSIITAERLAVFRSGGVPAWQSFAVRGRHFFLLTSSLLGSGLADEGLQWEWLERELASLDGAPTYLAWHHPLYLDAADEPGGTYWNVEPEPRARLLKLMKSHHVRAVFTGHIHRGLRHEQQGTALFTQTAVSFGLGAPEERVEGWSLVTLTEDAPPQIDFHRLPPGGTTIPEQR